MEEREHADKLIEYQNKRGGRVIIEDVNRINSPNKVKLCKNIVPFLEYAKKLRYRTVIVTNQSSVSRSIISKEEYLEITDKMLSYLPTHLYPDLILASFHLPNNENNLNVYQWRKPGDGMFRYAIDFHSYEPFASTMIGDKLTDLIPAYKCKVKNLIYLQ